MTIKSIRFALLLLVFAVEPACAQATEANSNLWPVHRDLKAGFRISYPPTWVIVPAKGPNVRFSANPPTGAGNCNVVARPNAELSGLNQVTLNREIESLPAELSSWAEYIGLPTSQIRLLQTRRGRIHDVSALMGVVETHLENLEGKFTRKQIVALTFTPGFIWTLNCGASTSKPDDARARFAELQPTFNKIFGSFGFLK